MLRVCNTWAVLMCETFVLSLKAGFLFSDEILSRTARTTWPVSRNEADYSRRDTHGRFPILKGRTSKIIRQAHLAILWPEKWSWSNTTSAYWNNVFTAKRPSKWAAWKIMSTGEKLPWEPVVEYFIARRAGPISLPDFLASRGKN